MSILAIRAPILDSNDLCHVICGDVGVGALNGVDAIIHTLAVGR